MQDLWLAYYQISVENISEGITKIKCKYEHDSEKCETFGIKYKDCDYCLDYIKVKDNLTEYRCLCCNKNYQKKFDKILKKRFGNTYTFSNHDTNKFTLLLRKGVYSYEYMDA